MDGLIILSRPDGSYVKISNSDMEMVDCYGNQLRLSDIELTYKQNSPSYDELYDYWINTKHNLKYKNGVI